ncbi:hypothetical protein ACWDG1_22050 [Streptomyces sp. NPDC001177]
MAAKADKFADDLEKVGAALSAYEAEIQPLVAKLKSLKDRAQNFRLHIAGDDHWREDEDNVQLNNDLVHDVNATTHAFWQAEVTCHNKITALVHGTTLIIEDGAQKRLLKRGTSTYGFTEDLLDSSDELPWGKTVEKERHGLDWLGHQIVEFGKGFFVDGLWGTIRGLGTMVGFDGLDAMGEAWTHLSKLATGIAITLTPLGTAYWLAPDDKLPAYLKESRQTVVETGKALIAYDEWGKNPARAGGAVTFNAVTTIFTGGAGSAAKSGAVARTIGALGKAGRLVDPMTYIGKAAKFGTVKVADLFGSLKNLKAGAYTDVLSGAGKVQPDGSVLKIANDVPVVVGNHIEWPDGTRLNLDDGSVIKADGTAAAAKVELSAADRAMLERSLPHGETSLVGAGDETMRAVGRAGDDLPRSQGSNPGSGSSTSAEHTASSRDLPSASTNGRTGAHAAGPEATGTSDRTVGNAHTGFGSGGHGDSGTDDLGRTGDDEFDTGMADSSGPGGGVPAHRPEIQRPSFMRDGNNPYGPRGSLSLEQIEEIQVYRANHDPEYRSRFYRKNGTRLDLDLHDESGFTPPQLTQLSDNAPWIRAKEVPAPPKPHYLDDNYISVKADTVKNPTRLRILEEATQKRHFAVQWDNMVEDWKAEAGRAHHIHGTGDSAAQWGEAKGAYIESHTVMRDAAGDFGEKVAEYHYVSEHYPDFEKQTLLGPKNGNDQFDQVWKHEDGRVVVIEAKSSPGTELGRRTLPGGKQVSQGSREYFFDILAAMERRGEDGLVDALEEAYQQGKLEYVVVKGQKNAGTYTGYLYRRFDISKGTLP